MKKNYALTSANTIAGIDDEEADEFAFEHWRVEAIIEWLQGLRAIVSNSCRIIWHL